MAERHTLGEAARLLRISRHTLDKWIKRINEAEQEKAPEQRQKITLQRHAYDYRFHTITTDDLQRIREARAQMPGHTDTFIPSYSSLAFDRRPTGEGAIRDALPTVTPVRRQRPLQRHVVSASSEVLPVGWMSRTDCADLHGFPRTTLRRWCEQGLVEISPETFGGEHGQFVVAQPITAAGMRQFYALTSRRADFTRCPSCPHETSEEPTAAGDDVPETLATGE